MRGAHFFHFQQFFQAVAAVSGKTGDSRQQTGGHDKPRISLLNADFERPGLGLPMK